MRTTASNWWVAMLMVIFAAAGIIAVIARVAEQTIAEVVPTSPIKIERLVIVGNDPKPVKFRRQMIRDATGIWRVQYYRLGLGGELCSGQGGADYLASEPKEYEWTHADWTGDPDCDEKVKAASPGKYWTEVEWTFTFEGPDGPITTTERRLVPFEIR